MSVQTVFEVLSLLTPYDVTSARKMRIGAPYDGGYIMLDMLQPRQTVFSFGLSLNILYEFDLAMRGHRLFMFDHTIDGLVMAHPGFHWFKEGLGATDDPAGLLFSLDHHLQRVPAQEDGMVLKIDVEGAEWDVLAAMPPATLRRFDQIVLELHDFRRLGEPEWRARASAGLRKLTQSFTIHHVHANNYAPVVVLDGWPVADVVEISLVRTELVTRSPSSALLPTYLDAANDPRRPDLPLWFFPYFPTGSVGDMGALVAAQHMSVERMGRTLVLA